MDMEHERRLATVEALSKSNSARLDMVEKRQDNLDDLVISVKTLAIREENVEKDVREMKDTTLKEMKGDIKTILEKPAKRWDNLWNTVLVAIITAMVGFLMGQLL